jgi:hypothetical protein
MSLLILAMFQTVIILWIGLWLLGRSTPLIFILGALAAAGVSVLMAMIMGIPFWGEMGDAYDHGVSTWLFLCAVIGLARWAQGLRK